MNPKTIPKLITILSSLCVEVSMHTDADIFFSFRPHVGKVHIEIHNIGWEKIREPNTSDFVFVSDPDGQEVIESLERMIRSVGKVASNYNYFKQRKFNV